MNNIITKVKRRYKTNILYKSMEKSLLVETENYKIYKSLEHSIYTILFRNVEYNLISSLVKSKIIAGSSSDNNYKTVTFKAYSLQTFDDYCKEYERRTGSKALFISDACKMAASLVKQLSYLLHKTSSTVLGYNTNDIIVINNDIFVYLNNEMISSINGDTERTMISFPFSSRDFFFSPEMLEVREIPSFVHYKTAYFSLACLMICSILGDNEFYLDYVEHKDPSKILSELNNHPIKESKVYWFLSRCLVEDPKNRSFILI